MRAQEIMSSNPACCTPSATAQEVARIMKEHDCGCVPVVDSLESRRLVGVVTDRDLAVRGIAEGKGADAKVSEVMTESPFTAGPDTDLREIQEAMAERQLRRVPIVDAGGCCVGIVAQADLARSAGERVSERDVAVVVERISEPAGRSGSGNRGGELGNSEQRR